MNNEQDSKDGLETALREIERLREENNALRKALTFSGKQATDRRGLLSGSSQRDSLGSAAKIALFRSLFQGRDDVYAVRWESSNGASGYSPAHSHDDDPALCRRPRQECQSRGERRFLPLTDEVLHAHLTGRFVVGVYPLLPADDCCFLAVDFDRQHWEQDITEYLGVCRECGIPVYPERSRSGSGGHVWMFFAHPVAAITARRLGTLIIAGACNRRIEIGLESFDRMFPNQDLTPKGGLGNLIALPLQKKARERNNSIFLDDSLRPATDQWDFLQNVRKISKTELGRYIDLLLQRVPGLMEVEEAEGAVAPDDWGSSTAGKRPSASAMAQRALTERSLNVHASAMLVFERSGLSSTESRALLACASFGNPDYYHAQRLRLSVFGKPRVINCADVSERQIALPRGCLGRAEERLRENGVRLEVDDRRFAGTPIDVSFLGELRENQERAFQDTRVYDIGVLCAPTAFGKTVVALRLIADRRVNTLILVHRKEIADLWREKVLAFLSVDSSQVGTWTGAKKKSTGVVDIATLQSLVRRGTVQGFVEQYGHVVIDECHHVPAFSFEQVMKRVKARYVLGLTATPVRRDGHHPIIFMQCGPIRFRSSEKKEAQHREFDHLVLPRVSGFRLDEGTLPIQAIYGRLAKDDTRNQMIIHDVCRAHVMGRCILVLTERRDHLVLLQDALLNEGIQPYSLHGTLKRSQIRTALDAVRVLPHGRPFVILATGRFIGEGFDEPRLDTLFLTLPISWKGTLQQYAGRLHRRYDGKNAVVVYDYVDSNVSVLQRMYQKRLTGYRSIGYRVEERTGPEVPPG